MEDQELLELAAKAAGIQRSFQHPVTGEMVAVEGPVSSFWNPLEDEGEALRLALKLNLGIIFDFYPGVRASDLIGKSFRVRIWCIAGWIKEEFNSEEEKLVAARMCIVRAAAEIGRAMK